jgi:muramoyltetrapeptide carboxypeptidase
MRIPRALKKGDTIGIVAPARKISYQEIAATQSFLEESGYHVFYEETLFAEDHQFAGSDRVRQESFQHLLDHPEIAAILCARGGYGSARIIDSLDFTTFCKDPKWICGYSDMTVFHSHIQKNYGIATLHSTMPINITPETKKSLSVRSMISLLEGERMDYRIEDHPFNRSGKAEGILTGGNLSILYSLNGTPSEIDTQNKILFIEDLDEYLYHVDRMVLNLKRGKKLDHIKGLIIGGMSEMRDNTIPFGMGAEQIIRSHCEQFDFPICFGFPAGHLLENLPLKLGVKVSLDVQNDYTALKEMN